MNWRILDIALEIWTWVLEDFWRENKLLVGVLVFLMLCLVMMVYILWTS